MAVGAVCEIISKDPAEFTVGKYTIWTVVLGTVLIVLSYAIHVVN
jgi:hypothetical protein